MGEYSNEFLDVLYHPEEYGVSEIEKAHLHYRTQSSHSYTKDVIIDSLNYHNLRMMIRDHIGKTKLHYDISLSDMIYQEDDYDWFIELSDLVRSNEPSLETRFLESTAIIKELVSLLTTENEFVTLPVRALWLTRMIRSGKPVVNLWEETIKDKKSHEWFNIKDRRKLGFGIRMEYLLPYASNRNMKITVTVPLKRLLRALINKGLHWNLLTGDFEDEKYKAQWESANVLYLGEPIKHLIKIYNKIIDIMEGYFFLHFYGIDPDTIDRYQELIEECIFPNIKNDAKMIMVYMASLHEEDVPNVIHKDLLTYTSNRMQLYFHEDFLYGYGRYGVHRINFNLLEKPNKVNPITIVYMFKQEYKDVPSIIQEIYKYFLSVEQAVFRGRCYTPRSLAITFASILKDRNRRNKDRRIQYVMMDMSEEDLREVGGFPEFLMNAHIGTIEHEIVEEEPKPPVSKPKPATPSLSWKEVSRTAGEWKAVYRDNRDFGNIDGVVPDADSIAINNKYAEQYMDRVDLMYSSAIKY